MDQGWQQGLLPFFPGQVATGQSLGSVCACVWLFFFVLFNFFSSNLNSRVLLVSVYIGQVTVL